MSHRQYFFTLNVSYSRCQQLYMKGNHTVVLIADSGERVQLPSRNLRPFIDSRGLKGRFRLLVDVHNKVKSFDKVT